MLKNKIALCVLVLIIISVSYIFASDVIVQNGCMTVDGDMQVGDYYNPATMDVYGTINADSIGDESAPYAYLSDTEIDGDLYTYGGILINDVLELSWNNYLYQAYFGAPFFNFDDIFYINGPEIGPYVGADCDFIVSEDLYVYGDIYGDLYPLYAMYDQKTRGGIIEQVKKEVPPDKQNGATLFFNKDTKKIENYIASEGKFYDLQGNVIHELPKVVKPATKYETVYQFDSKTGQVRSISRPVTEKYQIKEGYSLDSKTGNFVNKKTDTVVSREEALEIYAASEGKIYDLEHNFLRDANKKNTREIASVGDFTGKADQVKKTQNNTDDQGINVKPASLN